MKDRSQAGRSAAAPKSKASPKLDPSRLEEHEAAKKQAAEDNNYLNSLTASMDEISLLPLSPKRSTTDQQTPVQVDNVRENLNSAQAGTMT